MTLSQKMHKKLIKITTLFKVFSLFNSNLPSLNTTKKSKMGILKKENVNFYDRAEELKQSLTGYLDAIYEKVSEQN